jgi:urea transporter
MALLLGFDVGLSISVLLGYNAFLVGLAIATFGSSSQHSDYSVSIILSTIVCSSFSSVVFVMLGKLLVPFKSPPLTLPFNMVTILFLAAAANMSHVSMPPLSTPTLPDYESAPFDGITAQSFFAGIIRGVDQFFLAENIISGVLALLGLTVCSRISAVAAFWGSALGAASALAMGVLGNAVEQGMFGFIASLTVTAMFMFYTPSIGAGVLATLAGFMTVVCQQALATMLEPLGLPFMTLPFCLVGLPFIIIQGTTSIVIAVPLSSMTIPEDHLKVVQMLEDGFT